MPYEIKHLPSGQWAKVRKDTGKIVSRHATRAKARGSIIAELANTHEAEVGKHLSEHHSGK